MGNVDTGGLVFRTTVYSDSQFTSQCDPFWTLQNGGYCSDALGNYLRKDGSVVPVEELTGDGRRLVRGIDNSTLIVGVLLTIITTLVLRGEN